MAPRPFRVSDQRVQPWAARPFLPRLSVTGGSGVFFIVSVAARATGAAATRAPVKEVLSDDGRTVLRGAIETADTNAMVKRDVGRRGGREVEE